MNKQSTQKGNSHQNLLSNEAENIITSWRAYRKEPEKKENELLTALDALIVRAVRCHNRERLDHALSDVAMQEVRLKLVPQRFLFSSPPLRNLGTSAENSGWLAVDGEKVAQTIAKLVFLVARWEVRSVVRAEERYQTHKSWWSVEDPQESAAQVAQETFRQRALRRRLRARGYTARQRRLIKQCFGGAITQAELGRALGLTQGAASKRLGKIKRLVSRVCADHRRDLDHR